VPIHIAPSHEQQEGPSRLIANSVRREQLGRPDSRKHRLRQNALQIYR